MIILNGKEYAFTAGQTILELAEANGIKMPTLCHDARIEPYGACGLCVCDVKMGAAPARLMRACATKLADGMVIETQSERVTRSRRFVLDMLLSDHTGDCIAPCSLACPGGTDCQKYAALIARGEYHKAAETMKDVIPIPASIGRICPHPCEKKCRRALVEAPVSLAALKAFGADMDLKENTFVPDCLPDTGKRVAVIGGGPAGLTAAYHLRRMGHEAHIFDKMPKLGGMLRYGIPEYRLPKAVLDKEISLIEQIGCTRTRCSAGTSRSIRCARRMTPSSWRRAHGSAARCASRARSSTAYSAASTSCARRRWATRPPSAARSPSAAAATPRWTRAARRCVWARRRFT